MLSCYCVETHKRAVCGYDDPAHRVWPYGLSTRSLSVLLSERSKSLWYTSDQTRSPKAWDFGLAGQLVVDFPGG